MENLLRPATLDHLAQIKALLTEASLPIAGVDHHIQHFYVLEQHAHIIAVIGFEPYPPYALVRSLVVAKSSRGRGCGNQLLQFVLSELRNRQFIQAYALTTTVVEWLQKSGFEIVERQAIPRSLHASVELRGACPDSAIALRIRL